MEKKYFIIICLILFIISLTTVSATDINQTDSNSGIISLSDDNTIEVSADSGTFLDLQNKINNASEGSTVELFNNYIYDDTFSADGIVINKSLTIEGNGYTIDGANQARIFFINATSGIKLNNIVFTNATASFGGAILFNNTISDVSITNSVFTNNSLSDDKSCGGAIDFKGNASNVLFENDTFENNFASSGYGDTITFNNNAWGVTVNGCDFKVNKPHENNSAAGGAFYFIKNVVLLFINNCEFNNLTARAGGAIFVEGNLTFSLINNTKFVNNTALTKNYKYGGGAISVEGNVDLLYVLDCEFINNTATTSGGAIKFMRYVKNLFIYNAVFDENYAPYGGALSFIGADEVLINNSKFTNNKGRDNYTIYGGAIYVMDNLTNANIIDSLFENNNAYSGGAIYVEGNMDQNIIYNTNFTNNTAFTQNVSYGGGAIAVNGNATNNIINQSIFYLNCDQTHGGGINFQGNASDNIITESEFIDNNAGYGCALAVSQNNENMEISKCIFATYNEGEQEVRGGGAIYFIGSAYDVIITDCVFIGNSARAGGAIFVEGNLTGSLINNTKFVNNTAFTKNDKYGGGAISVEGSVDLLYVLDCEFINNTATTSGGAVKFMGYVNDLFINNTVFDENYAPYGGALSFIGADEVLINNSKFTNNKGRDNYTIYGGAIYVMDNFTNANIIDSLFENNNAYSGGAIYVEGNMDQNIIYNTNFTNNTAFTQNVTYGGGAIAVNGNATNNIINQSIFYLNCDQTHGGGINFQGNASNNIITESEFIDNNAGYGCALAVSQNNENMEISKCIFATYNEGEQEVRGGGAMYFIGSAYNVNITDCIFKGNIARAGGSIYFEKKVEKSRIENCTFENNIVTTANIEYGGGTISVENNAIEFTIANCNFINNTASTRGGAIFIKNSKNVLIENNLFVNNSATLGKAIYLKKGNNVVIQGSQFINNTGGIGDIYYLDNIDSTIINSTFEGESHIFVSLDASVTLSNNEELDSYKIGDYFVYSDGVLSLENNTLTNVIYNNGEITSPTTMICLNNETVNITDVAVALTAKCVDDNDNYIVSDYGFFYMNESEIKAFYRDDVVLNLYFDLFTIYNNFIVNATSHGLLSNCTYKIGIINIVSKKAVYINASDIVLDAGQYGEIEVKLSEDATGTVSAIIDDEEYLAVIKDGNATIIIPPLESGEYEAVIEFPGDINYEANYTSILITVLDKIAVNAPDVTKYYGGSERFVVNVTKSDEPVDNATVIIEINGVSYTKQTDENGTTSIALGLPSGNYTANVKVDDISVNSTVTILPTVNGTDIIKVYKNETQYYATFVDSNGDYLASGTNVTFNINGVFYTRIISGDKGLAKLNINLAQGEYIITAINPNTTEKSSNNITVISRIINNSDITKFYRNETQYTATILGDDGNPVGQGETVKFNINGVIYERQTNESGQVKLNLNLAPGDYIITAEYGDCMVSNSVKILPVLTAEDLTKQYGTDTPFEAKLVDGQGNAYANQVIGFNINGVFYNRTTDSSGIAKLNINLQAGEYIITSTYNQTSISNKITVTA